MTTLFWTSDEAADKLWWEHVAEANNYIISQVVETEEETKIIFFVIIPSRPREFSHVSYPVGPSHSANASIVWIKPFSTGIFGDLQNSNYYRQQSSS